MKKDNITNVVHLPYLFNETENMFLKEILKTTEKEYDFGILCAATDVLHKTTDIKNFTPPRRNKLVNNLVKNGFKVNVISGFAKERDISLAKCKRILNIHGQYSQTPSSIFEHIRCNRLLDAGFSILSENCEYMDPSFVYPNLLEFKSYDEIYNLKNENKNTIKIIDCFTFYNEIDMLEYRLNTLNEFVDYFVIVEATLTHVGKTKDMYLQKILERNSISDKIKKKIVQIVVDDFPFNEKNINFFKNEQWKNEKFQRNCITRGFIQINKFDIIHNDDIIIISDVDEIPNPDILTKIKLGTIELKTIAQFEQDFYYYNLESKMDHQWYFSKIFRWNWFLTTEYTLDDIRMKPWITIKSGGWHLSYFGDSSFISNKIKNFAHQEYNSNDYTDQEKIEYRMKNNIDIYNRDINIINIPYSQNTFLPPNYSFFIKEVESVRSCRFIHENVKKVFVQPHVVMGLGNCLFLVAMGVYYAEKYKYKLVLDSDNDCLKYGTANMFNRKRLNGSYFENIFKNISQESFTNGTNGTSYTKIHNDFESLRHDPTDNETTLLITGYNQNIDLFFEIKDRLLHYLYLDDPSRKKYIYTKYFESVAKQRTAVLDESVAKQRTAVLGNDSFNDKIKINPTTDITNVFVGLRLDTDGGFKYSNLTYNSYKYVMDTIVLENDNVRFFIVSDINPCDFLINSKYAFTVVNESDIDQIYFAQFCSHFILSESTYHYWVALLNTNNPKVYVFNNTELVSTNDKQIDYNNRNLIKGLGWNIIDQTEDTFDFYFQKDQSGFDMYNKNTSVPVLKELSLSNTLSVGFNTVGWIKNKIDTLTDLTTFGKFDGIYIKNPSPKRYIFIHSCNLHGTKMLEHLLESVSHITNVTNVITKIFVINIGPPITDSFGELVEITNYSEDVSLFEIPTLNKIKQFSIDNPDCYILYLHTKGLSYKFENVFVNDWIDMMLYFLTIKNNINLLHYYDTIGCNYYQTDTISAHWSGNFWWARSNYLKNLPDLEEKSIQRFTPEFYASELWLFKGCPYFYEIHKSPIKDHYLERYQKERYQKERYQKERYQKERYQNE